MYIPSVFIGFILGALFGIIMLILVAVAVGRSTEDEKRESNKRKGNELDTDTE